MVPDNGFTKKLTTYCFQAGEMSENKMLTLGGYHQDRWCLYVGQCRRGFTDFAPTDPILLYDNKHRLYNMRSGIASIKMQQLSDSIKDCNESKDTIRGNQGAITKNHWRPLFSSMTFITFLWLASWAFDSSENENPASDSHLIRLTRFIKYDSAKWSTAGLCWHRIWILTRS